MTSQQPNSERSAALALVPSEQRRQESLLQEHVPSVHERDYAQLKQSHTAVLQGHVSVLQGHVSVMQEQVRMMHEQVRVMLQREQNLGKLIDAGPQPGADT